MLHRAKHGLITAKLGQTNSWIYLLLPPLPHHSISFTNFLFVPQHLFGPPICLKCHSPLTFSFSSSCFSSLLECIYYSQHFQNQSLLNFIIQFCGHCGSKNCLILLELFLKFVIHFYAFCYNNSVTSENFKKLFF